MKLATARACFDALAARGSEPRLEGSTGTWEVDLPDAAARDRRWFIRCEGGRLTVGETPPKEAAPDAHIVMRESDFVRLACGAGNENLVSAALRGVLTIEGDLRFAQLLQVLLPLGRRNAP
jgi:hypothetical protein